MLTRRGFITSSIVAGLAISLESFAASKTQEFFHSLAALEDKNGGRLGAAVIDTGNRQIFSYRSRERFALCSTFKVLAVAYILQRVDKGQEDLSREIEIIPSKIVSYSPITEKSIGRFMTLSEICRCAITHSDNTAGNIMLESFGGPKSLTAWLRGIGDSVTRLDRWETPLNDVAPGDLRDTSTPQAMAKNLERILLGDPLGASSKEILQGWMIDNTTGDYRLRAGLPENWKIGDKTGSGERGETNDIAILYPPHRKPLIVAVYYQNPNLSMDARNSVLANAGKIISMM